MKDTEIIYSEDLGATEYSGKKVKCCFNIYHKCKDGHKQDFDIPGITTCRHIFRSGKYQHSDDILNDDWVYRVAAWGNLRLLKENEFCPNEIVFKCEDNIKDWLGQKLEECPYKEIMNSVTTPNLPAWRLRKWLKEQYENSIE